MLSFLQALHGSTVILQSLLCVSFRLVRALACGMGTLARDHRLCFDCLCLTPRCRHVGTFPSPVDNWAPAHFAACPDGGVLPCECCSGTSFRLKGSTTRRRSALRCRVEHLASAQALPGARSVSLSHSAPLTAGVLKQNGVQAGPEFAVTIPHVQTVRITAFTATIRTQDAP